MPWERVVAIRDFHDGPRGGVAFLDGQLHVFQSVWDDAKDDYADEFDLMPIDKALLPLIEEQERIWQRWLAASKRGEVSPYTDPHMTLPADRHRSDELAAQLGSKLEAHPEKSVRRLAEFRLVDDDAHAEVRWSSPKS